MDFGRAHMDAQQALDLPAPVLSPGAGPARGTGRGAWAVAQAGQQGLFESAAGLCIAAGADAFV
ncbi:hypothetical protein ADJ79_01810 [Ottowia sp. oral taxon 894]|nr:hypothetical protein ADJ79_01810 [Ottowia sp. oral taxon 894]